MSLKENLAQGDSPRKRRKISIPWYGDLPAIDEQIRYIKRVRKQIYTESKVLRNDLRMIHAIEQTLLAAKLFFKTETIGLKLANTIQPKLNILMRHVTESTTLTTRLEAIRKITEQFTKEDSERSPEQLVAEIEFIKGLLDETKNYLIAKNNLIP